MKARINFPDPQRRLVPVTLPDKIRLLSDETWGLAGGTEEHKVAGYLLVETAYGWLPIHIAS